jgi:hypothetical protein
MHLANRCAPWKISNGAENLVLQALEPPFENIQLYMNREGEYVTWKGNREERGRVCRESQASR